MCVNLRKLLAAGKFDLRKFALNSSKLLPTEINLDNLVKTLGVHYFPTFDEFRFKVNLEESNNYPTKRTFLSEVSKLFDPLGWLSPVIIKAKILFQGLWQAGLTWDQQLPKGIAETWLKLRSELHLNGKRISHVNVRVARVQRRFRTGLLSSHLFQSHWSKRHC